MTEKAGRSAPDWERIEVEYSTTSQSSRDIAARHGVSHTAVNKRAAAYGWRRPLTVRAANGPEVADIDDPDEGRAGFLYVIYVESAGERFCKIGIASSLANRLSAHQTSSPFPVRVAAAYFVEDMRAEERTLHEQFAEKRVRGEWFRLGADDLKVIAARSLLLEAV